MCEKIILILAIVLMSGCSPLRNVQTHQHTAMEISDSTLVRLIHEQLEHMTATLHQTIIEYSDFPRPQLPPTDTLVAKDLMPEVSVSHPTPRRIIHTKVETILDRTTHTDSISRSRINTAARSEEQSQVDESPNTAGMLWLKWLAVSLVALLLLLLILKLKF